MEWSAGLERLTLSGGEGLLCFTTTRAKALPAGEQDLGKLREAASVGARPRAVVAMRQAHGARIVRVEHGAPHARDRVLEDCDGLVTAGRGVALLVRSADCLPVVVWDPAAGVVGAAHAGWRGIKAGIPRSLAEAVGPARACAAIGPGIGPCCYAVGPEFAPWFGGNLRRQAGKLFLDLAGAARGQLLQAGIAADRIAQAPWCTCCEEEFCCSYRREGAAAGRMVTCAMLK